MCEDEGPVYTKGNSFRARAEAQQRRYRSKVLKVECSEWGHVLSKEAADAGCNFVSREAFKAVKKRAATGKGVDVDRTFGNMLSSQAMCFNLFGPLMCDTGLQIASRALSAFVDDLIEVKVIQIEYTPTWKIFRDQTPISGVDCDVLVEYTTNEETKGLLVIETKFVEPEFSTCQFHKRRTCPDNITLKAPDFSACKYVSEKNFAYWEHTAKLRTLRDDSIPSEGCPFSGPLWQLWVNHTLAHAEAEAREAKRAAFAVCTPMQNEALLADPNLISSFSRLVADSDTVIFMPLEELISELNTCTSGFGMKWRSWALGLKERYLVE